MIDANPILADTDIGKVVFPVIFVLIWIISAVVSAMNKRQQKERNERLRREAERLGGMRGDVPGPPVPQPAPRRRPNRPLPDAIARQLPPARPAPPPLPKKKPLPGRPGKSVKRKPVKPQLAMPGEPQQPRVMLAEEAVATPPVATRPTATPQATAVAISKWLNPQTMRQQFILTEILQPPKALRDE
jgi:hypothetical protein